jgi:hypothetical protein
LKTQTTARLFAFALVSLFAAGCGGAEAVKDFEALAEKACACKDSECYTKVSGDMTGLMEKHKSTAGSEEQGKKIAEAVKKMTECGLKLAGAAPAGSH